MKKVSFTFLALTLIACGGTAGISIGDPPPQETSDPPDAVPVTSQTAFTVPDALPHGEDAGDAQDTSVVVNPDAGTDAHVGSGEDAGDSNVPDTSVPVADAGRDSEPDSYVPPTCQTRGSCTVSPTQCYEYEDNAVLLPQHQASCTGVWAFAPCNRAQWTGACEVTLTGESACPKARYVYSSPVTQAQITSTCANKGGTVIFP
jgi:hypothetical protein